MNLEIGDLVIINDRPYEGCFEDDIGYIVKVYSNMCYIHLFRCGEAFVFLYKEKGFVPYEP